ncbi:arginine deiminase [Caloramator quimbayensis]|uniref:Arginine deiminase n=1 Tax=Caloramator quimbayensis TaxID=1147123 RepID=A0A1T4WTV9_9CLOT|nr:arginine deiminase [Caloramator quimbayensis]SKA80051.1 arginine deiminase [Caloramator quimbayensis]
MNSFINVTSEIGKLKKVLLHRPGQEVENLVPEYLGRLLFDDIPYLKIARQEHDIFAQVLRENGVEVLYLEELAAESIEDENIKKEFIDEFLYESGITSEALKEALSDYLLSKTTRDMIDTVMAGVRKEEIKIKEAHSLSELMMDEYPFYLDPMPNLYFTRDPGASIGSGLTINRMRTEARRRETLFLKYIHKYHKFFKNTETPLWYDRTMPFAIEGGDELVLSDKVLAIGCSERTSAEAIEIVAKNLFDAGTSFEKILVFEIPKCRAFMHLDTVFTMVDYDKFTIHPGIEGPLSVYEITRGANNNLNFRHTTCSLEETLSKALNIPSVELIKCGGGDLIIAGREQWNDGSNTLAIAPGVVVTYERNYVTNEILDKKGIKVLSIPSSELSRGRGGPRCMSMPLERENLK